MDDECRANFETWYKSRVYKRTMPRDGEGYVSHTAQWKWEAWQAAWNAHSAPEKPLPSPVRYTDGSMSREYDEQPETVRDEALAETVKSACSYSQDDDQFGYCYSYNDKAVGHAVALAQAPLLTELRQARERIVELEQKPAFWEKATEDAPPGGG